MNKLPKLLLFLAIISCNSNSKSKEQISSRIPNTPINGFYEYQSTSGQQNQYILIDTLHGKYYGLYYRTEPKRGKGQWYYTNSLTKLRVEKDSIHFVLGASKLFNARSVIPGKITRKLPVKTDEEETELLLFRGKISNEVLRLVCESPKGDCPDQSMLFNKIPLPE
ncbi:MAG: hypothetical protein ACR2MM_11110 [Flavobacteriaceae bacterium]